MAGPLYSDSWYQTIHVRLSLYPMFIHNHMSRILLCPSEEEFLFSIRSMSKIAWAYGMEVRRVLFAIVCKVLKSRVIPNGKHRAIWRWGLPRRWFYRAGEPRPLCKSVHSPCRRARQVRLGTPGNIWNVLMFMVLYPLVNKQFAIENGPDENHHTKDWSMIPGRLHTLLCKFSLCCLLHLPPHLCYHLAQAQALLVPLEVVALEQPMHASLGLVGLKIPPAGGIAMGSPCIKAATRCWLMAPAM